MSKVLSSIDIGSNNIVCLISTINSDNKIFIRGASVQEAVGIKGGNIVNVESVTQSILNAVIKAEKIARRNIGTLVVNISGILVKSKTIRGTKNYATSKKITKKDIFSLAKTLNDSLKEKHKIAIHIVPIASFVNGNQVDNPVGMMANSLDIDFYIMYVDEIKLNNIRNCFNKVGLKVDNFVFSGYASALGVLNDHEKEVGSLVINIGANLTTFSIVKNNRLLFGNSIQMAGDSITKDIAEVLGVSTEIAEKIKLLNTNFYLDKMDENEIIQININNEESFRVASTKKGTVNDIAKARIDDIIDVVLDIIDKRDLTNSFDSIVLTGSCSNIQGLDAYVTKITKIKSRIGLITDFYVGSSMDERLLKGPSFATAVGLINFVNLFYRNNNIEDYRGSNSIFSKVINFLINLFIS
ncbi:MAG: cell division protein FtsA [Rickettsiales bacterium]|nr:cell division protein FtsA [Rickettsiales bacterium]